MESNFQEELRQLNAKNKLKTSNDSSAEKIKEEKKLPI